MMKYSVIMFCALLHLITAEEHHQIKLEDIERDNLVSERQVHKKETLVAQQTQHLRPPSIQAPDHYSLQVQHNGGGGSSVNFVTPAPIAKNYYTKDYRNDYIPQVHEADQTYAAPSRQSLIMPAIGGGLPATTYLTPQPQYVYVQAQPQQHNYVSQQQHQLPYVGQQQQHQQQPFLHVVPQTQQAYLMIPTTYVQQPHSAQQYAAYVNDQNSVVSYSHGETGANVQSTSSSSTPKPDIIYAPSSTVAPLNHSPSSEFSIVKSIEPIHYTLEEPANNHLNHHNQYATGLQYVQSYKQLQQQYYSAPSYPSLSQPNNAILNYFGYQSKQPTSLIDSYVPSNLILAGQKSAAYQSKSQYQYQPQYQYQYQPQVHYQHQPKIHYQQPQHYHQAAPHYSPIPSASSAYNTIAYSVPQPHMNTASQYKRHSQPPAPKSANQS